MCQDVSSESTYDKVCRERRCFQASEELAKGLTDERCAKVFTARIAATRIVMTQWFSEQDRTSGQMSPTAALTSYKSTSSFKDTTIKADHTEESETLSNPIVLLY